MYCSKCGKELNEEMNFCPNCGMNISTQTMPDNIAVKRAEDEAERNVILRNLDKAIPIYLRTETIQAELERLYVEKKNGEKIDGFKLVCGFGIYAVTFLMMFIIMLFYYINISKEGKVTDNVVIIMVSSTFFVPLAIMLISDMLHSKHMAKKYNRKIKLLDEQMKEYINENMCDEVLFLPEKYRYHLAACYIGECIANGRAHTLSEAMNMYEEQLHRWKMENMQQQLLKVRQRTVFVVM